jgi:hypothetical protein
MKPIITLLLFAATIAIAQSQHTSGSLYMAPGIQQFSFSNLNSILTQSGYHKVPLTFGFGTGGYGEHNHLRIGGEGYYFSGSAKKESISTEIQGGWGYFYAGYKFGNNLWRFIPGAGLGWGGSTVSAIRTTNSSIGVLIDNQPNASVVSIRGTFLHTAITIERDLPGHQYLAVKATYNQGFSAKEWTAPGLTSSVSDSFSGFQLSLIIGFTLQ